MVGGGTARADDPTLTVRDMGVASSLRALWCRGGLDIPLSGKLAQTAAEVPLILCHGADAPDRWLHAWREWARDACCLAQWRPAWIWLMCCASLGTYGLTRVFSEGGRRLRRAC